MKYLVLKVAAGVFLGIVAAVGLYEAVNLWESSQLSKAYVEQQKREADDRDARIQRAADRLPYQVFTPEQTIALCGAPIREQIQDMSSFSIRYLSYKGEDGETILLLPLSDRKHRLRSRPAS